MRARDNPFATARVHRVRYRFDGLTWDEFLGRLQRTKYRGAIVGPEGAGKSTLLEDLRLRLTGLGLQPVSLRMTQESPRFLRKELRELAATLSSRHVVLLDGAEQMSRWAWWRFRRLTRCAGGLIITAHRPGLLPTVLACRTTPDLLAEIVSRLLEGYPAVSREKLDRLHQRHCGNVREALRELYDDFSASPSSSAAVAALH